MKSKASGGDERACAFSPYLRLQMDRFPTVLSFTGSDTDAALAAAARRADRPENDRRPHIALRRDAAPMRSRSYPRSGRRHSARTGNAEMSGSPTIDRAALNAAMRGGP